MRAKFIGLWVFIPLLTSVTSVLASPALQTAQTDHNAELFNQIIGIGLGGLLTILLRYLQRNQKKTTQRLETVEARSVDIAGIQKQADTSKTEIALLKAEIDLLKSELSTLKDDYKTVVQEKNQAVKALETVKEQRAFDEERYQFQQAKLNTLLAEEKTTSAKLTEQNSSQQRQLDQYGQELKHLRDQIATMKPMNELAGAIADSIRELIKTRTKELPVTVPTPSA